MPHGGCWALAVARGRAVVGRGLEEGAHVGVSVGPETRAWFGGGCPGGGGGGEAAGAGCGEQVRGPCAGDVPALRGRTAGVRLPALL